MTLKKKDGTEYFKYKRVEITKILKQFPIITYYQPAKNVMNNKEHIFGVSAATFTSILPYVYDEQKETLSEEDFSNLKYLTVNEMKKIMRNIIDFVVEFHLPQELQTMTCEECKKTFKKQGHTYRYNGKLICRNCYDILKQDRFTKRIPKRKVS